LPAAVLEQMQGALATALNEVYWAVAAIAVGGVVMASLFPRAKV
jgi:hypothetical protein